MCSERTLSAARAELNASVSTRAPCVNRVQPGPASSRFSKHSLLITFALSAAWGGVRRPVGGGMRSYMGNTKSADTIVPMALNTTPACQRSSCADASGRQHPACFALFREKKSPNLSLLQALHLYFVPVLFLPYGILSQLRLTLCSDQSLMHSS